MKIYYRISDKSYRKVKLPGATKQFCLENFLNEFYHEDITIIADNCDQATLDYINFEIRGMENVEVIQTTLSNAGSFVFAFDKALQLPDEEIVYFVEDDYLHQENINHTTIIAEGLERYDYVTLFDHPDKYESEYAYGETSYCCRTKSTHWRSTKATCMTFASKVKTLKEDEAVWKEHTTGSHPHDFYIFCDLEDKARCLGLCIPGVAWHTDLTYPLSKDKVEEMLEPWVVMMLSHQLRSKLNLKQIDLMMHCGFEGYRYLMFLDALRQTGA